jgi:paraquat-inducible protein A
MLSALHRSHSSAPSPCCGAMRGIDRGSGGAGTHCVRLPDEPVLESRHAKTRNIMDGIKMLFGHGYWYFGVMILLVSVILPLTKLLGLTWFLLSIHFGWSQHLRFKTGFYRFIDKVGRWSLLDPFTVRTFTPMIILGQLAHFNAMIGTDAFLAMVVLLMSHRTRLIRV